MSYDFDLIVIGGGPAGLSAAIRARWVKTASAIPASVLVLDPAGAGGLARLGQICLTGPSFAFHGAELMARLQQDIAQWEIPLLREAAVALERTGDIWTVHTPARTLRGLAVVLATGLRQLTDEPAVQPGGRLILLSGGYQRAAERFAQWSQEHRGRRLLLIGGASLPASLADFARRDRGRNRLACLCEPQTRIRGWREAADGLLLDVEEDGVPRTVACEWAMLDFHSLELAPPSLAFLPAALRAADGYSAAGPRGNPAASGLFAAGDCAGAPSLCVKALAQGAEAGFNAYRHIYQAKFGQAPPLFAFYVSPERPALDASDLPELDPARHRPVGLSWRSRFAAHPLSGYGEGRVASSALSPQEQAWLRTEVAEKMATVHVRVNSG